LAKGSVLRKVELSQPAGEPVEPAKVRLDLGCGKTTPEGWEGVDAIDFGQKHVHDVRKGLPWLAENSVDEVRSSHFVEHLTGTERIAFFNELYRVMKKDATALIITPNWSHSCAYGDPTHQWPPMSQWYPLYLHREWRSTNAPHAAFTCHFDHVIAGSWDGGLEVRTMEYRQFAMHNYTNGWRDLIVTLTARKD
jgi:predicted SAM-dependent methyltransferase